MQDSCTGGERVEQQKHFSKCKGYRRCILREENFNTTAI